MSNIGEQVWEEINSKWHLMYLLECGSSASNLIHRTTVVPVDSIRIDVIRTINAKIREGRLDDLQTSAGMGAVSEST